MARGQHLRLTARHESDEPHLETPPVDDDGVEGDGDEEHK